MGSSHSGSAKGVPHDAYQRRKIISELDHIAIDKGIKVLCEYVETPQSNVIYTKCFIPGTEIVDKPKGLICQCLGYSDYCDYFMIKVAQSYAKQGYIFFVWDQYGHGRSSGLWLYIEDMNHLMNDAMFICKYAQQKYPMQNNYLFGLSMGGNIVSRILIDQQQQQSTNDFILKWNGIVLFSPMVGLDEGIKYGRLVTYLITDWLCYYFPKNIILSKSRDHRKFSRDPDMAQWLAKNPMFFPFGPRPKTGVELLRSCEIVEQNSGLIGLTDIPLLVVHGTGDDTTKSSMSMKLIEKALSSQSSKDATHCSFEGGYHVLMTDSCRNECCDVVIQWMDKHSKEECGHCGV
eukprot:63072_1